MSVPKLEAPFFFFVGVPAGEGDVCERAWLTGGETGRTGEKNEMKGVFFVGVERCPYMG